MNKIDRRRSIIEHAATVFMDVGYASTSMSTIALNLGGSKGTLYNHFGSKEELFHAVILAECDREMTREFDKLVPTNSDVRSGLRDFGEAYVAILLSDQAMRLIRTVVSEVHRFPDLGAQIYQNGPAAAHRRLAEYIRQQIGGGKLRAADPLIAAERYCELCLVSLFQSRLWHKAPSPNTEIILCNVDAAIRIFMAEFGPSAMH